MPVGYLSLWVQPRSVTSGDLIWPWNLYGAMSRVTSSHVLTSISSTISIQVNRTTPNCVYSRFRWNLVEGCSSYDVITSWPDLTWPDHFFHQKLRKRCPISYGKFQRDSPNGVASSSEKLMGGASTPPDRARVKLEVLCEVKVRSKVNIRRFEVLGPGDQEHRFLVLKLRWNVIICIVKACYDYISHTDKRKRSRSGHKRSLYVKVVI